MARPLPSPRDPDALGLRLLYAVVFVEIGMAMPFMPVWLSALGLDPRVIGALVALPIAIRIVATAPLLSLIDRGLSARTLLFYASLALGITYALMPLAAGFRWPMLALLIAVNAVAQSPLVPSIDYMTLAAGRASGRIDYARIRVFGSVGFLVANLVGGVLLAVSGERIAVPVLLAGLALLASAVAYSSRERVPAAAPSSARDGPRPRLPRKLVLTIAAAALIQASHAAIYTFGSIYWSERGISSAWIGALWAIGVCAEILLFAGIGRLPAAWRSPYRLIAIGGVAAILRALGMAFFGDRLDILPALQALHAFSFGATQLGVMAAVSALAPDGARGRAQGSVGAATSLASASAMLACGLVYREAGGPPTFLLMAPLGLAGLCLAVLARSHTDGASPALTGGSARG